MNRIPGLAAMLAVGALTAERVPTLSPAARSPYHKGRVKLRTAKYRSKAERAAKNQMAKASRKRNRR